jgi:lipopolysaccharide biosynthesis glycosyltransferase
MPRFRTRLAGSELAESTVYELPSRFASSPALALDAGRSPLDSYSMNIIFCTDRLMLPALHVAAKQVLKFITGRPEFTIISEDLDQRDLDLLNQTLDTVGKGYRLGVIEASTKPFAKFPRLTGSLAAYYRLLAPGLLDCQKCLYIDCDTFCLVDLAPLFEINLGDCPVGMCAESPIDGNADVRIAKELGARASGYYYNSGVILFNCAQWREENLESKCLEYIEAQQPDYHEQSALNFILHGRIYSLPPQFNLYTNVRTNWPSLIPPQNGEGRLLHFVDFPKPWSRYGRWVHPFGNMWWNAYRETAHAQNGGDVFSSLKWNQKTWVGYKKTLKDKLLFDLYSADILEPKGIIK